MALPEPEYGLVISYSYVWRHESESGQAEGRKNRPCAIVAIVLKEDNQKLITVAPITHTLPLDLTVAMEIPPKVKKYLGLDGERSWIILDDFNEFSWPGYDLCLAPGKAGRYDYGLIPPILFNQMIARIFDLKRQGRVFSTSRDER